MSELRDREELEAHAKRAADKGLNPEVEMLQYSPTIRCIWLTEYQKRMTQNERVAA